jgi:hypothetical protein
MSMIGEAEQLTPRVVAIDGTQQRIKAQSAPWNSASNPWSRVALLYEYRSHVAAADRHQRERSTILIDGPARPWVATANFQAFAVQKILKGSLGVESALQLRVAFRTGDFRRIDIGDPNLFAVIVNGITVNDVE